MLTTSTLTDRSNKVEAVLLSAVNYKGVAERKKIISSHSEKALLGTF